MYNKLYKQIFDARREVIQASSLNDLRELVSQETRQVCTKKYKSACHEYNQLLHEGVDAIINRKAELAGLLTIKNRRFKRFITKCYIWKNGGTK